MEYWLSLMVGTQFCYSVNWIARILVLSVKIFVDSPRLVSQSIQVEIFVLTASFITEVSVLLVIILAHIVRARFDFFQNVFFVPYLRNVLVDLGNFFLVLFAPSVAQSASESDKYVFSHVTA